MTVSAIIDAGGPEKQPTLLDLEFFGREAHLIKIKQ